MCNVFLKIFFLCFQFHLCLITIYVKIKPMVVANQIVNNRTKIVIDELNDIGTPSNNKIAVRFPSITPNPPGIKENVPARIDV